MAAGARLFLVWTAALLAACSGASALTGKSRGASKDKGDAPAVDQSGGDESDGSETSRAAPPQVVAGAYLTCGAAPEIAVGADDAAFGCAVRDEGGKLALTVTSVEVAVSADGASSALATQIADKDAPWHFYVTVPKALQTKTYTTAVKVVSDVQTFQFALPDFFAGQPSAPAFVHIVFVTSETWRAESGGTSSSLASADALCQRLGQSVVPQFTWIAVLGAHGDGPSRDRDHLLAITGPVLNNRLNTAATREQIASDAGTFWTNFPGKRPNYYNDGAQVPNDHELWTGLEPDGTASSDNCEDWRAPNAQKMGKHGVPGSEYAWLSLSHPLWPCDGAAPIYCLSVTGH
jgi:hypothetical protein